MNRHFGVTISATLLLLANFSTFLMADDLFITTPEDVLANATKAGVYFERHTVAGIRHLRRCLIARCTSLEYVIKYNVPSCLAPTRASVIHDDLLVPIKIDEVGTPGNIGYQWTLSTTKLFSGPAAVVLEIGDICHDKS